MSRRITQPHVGAYHPLRQCDSVTTDPYPKFLVAEPSSVSLRFHGATLLFGFYYYMFLGLVGMGREKS